MKNGNKTSHKKNANFEKTWLLKLGCHGKWRTLIGTLSDDDDDGSENVAKK